MTIPLLDLKAQQATVEHAVKAAIERVAASQRFIRGPELTGCEEEISSYVGAAHGVGVSNGSDAIYLALLGLGVGPGDEVITTTYSFIASVESIVRTGATPVFVDIDDAMLMDTGAVAERVTKRTKAILAVHLFGRCIDMAGLERAAPGIPVVEDAAQAIGAGFDGTRAGALGIAGCFSFFPSKNLGCWGDGGMVTTSDANLARGIEALREHGRHESRRYVHETIGGNFRLDALQAAILRAKLPFLEGWCHARQQNAARYTEIFKQKSSAVVTPPSSDALHHDVFNQYVIRVPAEARDSLREHLGDAGISSAIYYPMSLHLQPCLTHLGHQAGDFPRAELASTENLALPIYPELGDAGIQTVAERVLSFFSR